MTLVALRPNPDAAKLNKPLPNQEIGENSHLLVVGAESDLSFLARGSR